jgi:hypothetical protein
MLQHKFVVERADGTEVRTCMLGKACSVLATLSKSDMLNHGQQIITSTLEAYGTPNGHSAMALTVGVPCGIATQLVLDGIISTSGILVPYTKEICDPLREQLEKEGIAMVERVL